MPLIYLSPSSRSYHRYPVLQTNEAEQMYHIAQEMLHILTDCGCRSILPDSSLTMEQRIAQANYLHADCYISLCSAAGTGAGIEGLYHPDKSHSQSLCQSLYEQLQTISPPRENECQNGMESFGGQGYAELRLVEHCPVLLHLGYHDRPAEAYWIGTHHKDIASALAHGILQFFSVLPSAHSKPASNIKDDIYELYIKSKDFHNRETAIQAVQQAKKNGFFPLLLYRSRFQ